MKMNPSNFRVGQIMTMSGKTISLQKLAINSSVALIILGSLFKIQHWPGSIIILIIGFSGLFLASIWNTFLQKSNTPKSIFLGLFIPLFAIHGFIKNLPYEVNKIGKWSLMTLGLVWCIYFLVRLFKKPLSKRDLFVNLFYVLAIILVFTGITFKILHYPYSFPILVVGFLLSGIYFLYETFISNN